MNRRHTPYGYRIENGSAVICEEQAEQIRKIYEGYLGGFSLRGAAKEAGMEATHSSVKRLLQNPHYLGDEFYLAIIDQETFDAFAVERQRRVEALGRDKREKKTVEAQPSGWHRQHRASATFTGRQSTCKLYHYCSYAV